MMFDPRTALLDARDFRLAGRIVDKAGRTLFRAFRQPEVSPSIQ